MDWGALAQIAGSGAIVGLLSTVFGWLTSRGKQKADTQKVTAESGKVDVESRVAESSDYRLWAERADKRAERAEERLQAAEEEARQAKTQADQCARDAANLREELTDLRRALEARDAEIRRRDDRIDELMRRIRLCGGGHQGWCPLAQE